MLSRHSRRNYWAAHPHVYFADTLFHTELLFAIQNNWATRQQTFSNNPDRWSRIPAGHGTFAIVKTTSSRIRPALQPAGFHGDRSHRLRCILMSLVSKYLSTTRHQISRQPCHQWILLDMRLVTILHTLEQSACTRQATRSRHWPYHLIPTRSTQVYRSLSGKTVHLTGTRN